MAWTKLKNTVRCRNCKAYYFPKVWLVKTIFECPNCQCMEWTYTKKEKEQ